ncbi:hypothetical protein [Cytophaga aurantiaca]|uniref:hypothetical protein n=1 Tax=Cytophaga aurantiaca TaxID=29530 RepID=UPI00037689FB|nr:hypothetical protein [Cytophaga aurantiaca]
MLEQDYSIDTLSEKIYSPKTKSYFKEVLQTYSSGSYRSCIVTLYTVVICDLIFKLEELSEIYNDETATKILKEIAEKQKDNPKLSEWETNIIVLIKEKTSILELYEIEAIYQLQKLRHLSAHPVLTESSILFTPNKETITAQIKNMLSFILTKPSFFSKKLATNIIIDISENKDRLLIKEDLKRYLEAKYFKNAKQDLLNQLFKKLWKFTFKLNNPDCESNREINISTLNIILNKDYESILQLIGSEQASFDFINDGEVVDYFIIFLFKYPKIYAKLNQSTRVLLDAEISANQNYKFLSWYKYDSFDGHFEVVTELVKQRFCPPKLYFDCLLELFTQFDKRTKYLDLSIDMFGYSSDFNSADNRFLYLIEPFLNEYTEDQLLKIIVKINSNSQISNRNRARVDNRKIVESIQNLNPAIDLSTYDSFRY